MRTPEDDGILDLTSEGLARPPAPPVKRASAAFGFTGGSPVQRVNDMPAGPTLAQEETVIRRVASNKAAEQDAQRRSESSAREADFRTRGVKHYVDAFGNLQPVRDEQGSEVFTEAQLDPVKDEKTGAWYKQRRTSTGEIQRTPADLRPSADENDPNLYYDLGNDRREKAGHADDILARVDERAVAANPALAEWRKTALKAKEDREKAVRKAALAPLEESQRAVEEKAAAATLRASDLATQAEDLTRQLSEIDANPAIKARSGGVLGIGASPTPEAERLQRQRADLQAKLEALQSERTTIETDLKEGPTAQAKARTKTELDLAKAQSEGVDIEGAIERRRAFLKSAGRPEDGDTYLRTLTAEAEKRGVFASESRKRLREAEKQDREIEANAAALAKDAAKGAQVKTNVHGRDIVANPVTEEERATLAQEFDALKAEADALDTSNPEAVAAFNARVESANKLRDQLNASAAFGNARAEQEKAAAVRADLVDRNATRLADMFDEEPTKVDEFLGRFTKEADRNAVRSAALAIRDDRTAAKVDWAKGLGYRTDHRGRFQVNPDSLLPDFQRTTKGREDGKAPAPSAREAIEGALAEKLITREQADDILGRVTANQRQIEAYAVNRTVTNRDFMAWYEKNVAPQLAEPIKRDASGKIIPTPSIQQAALAWIADPKNGSAVNDFVQRSYDAMIGTLPIYPVLAVAGRVTGSERLENWANDTLAFIEGRGDVRRDENFASSLASGVGSVVGFVSTGAVTGAAARGIAARSVVGLRAAGAPKFAAQLAAQLKHAPIFVAAGSQSAAATMRQLDEAGVAREDQWIPMLVSGGVTALTETAPMFRTIETYLDALGGKVKGEFGKRMTTYLATAAKEGVLQELPQQIADNAISLGYNPQVSGEDWVGKLFEGAGEAVAVGGIVGAGGTAVPTEVRNAVVGLVNAYRSNQTAVANRERVASVRAAREGMAPSVQAITSGDFEGIARRWNFNHAQEHGDLEITPAQAKAASELVTGTDEAMRAARAGVRAGADAGSTEALFAEAAAADAEAKHLATYSAALYVQPELDAIPEDAPMIDQATGQPMPQTQAERTRSRDAATALSRIALGVRPEALTAQQATALAGLAERLGVPAVTPVNDIPVVTDAARQWLGERSPTAASLLRPEAEMRAADQANAANQSTGGMKEGQAAKTEPAPATPAPANASAPADTAEAPTAAPDNRGPETPTPAGAGSSASSEPASATVSYTDDQGNRRTRPIPAGATTSDGKPVRNVTTARQWIAENAKGRVADVQFTPAPKAPAPAPAAATSPTNEDQEKARQKGRQEGLLKPAASTEATTPPPAAASPTQAEAQPEGVSLSEPSPSGQTATASGVEASAPETRATTPAPLPSQDPAEARAWVDEQFAAGYTRLRKLKGRYVLQNRAAGKAVAVPSVEALEIARENPTSSADVPSAQPVPASVAPAADAAPSTLPAPIIARGDNTPAKFVSQVFRAAELASNSKARPALIELAQRLSKANPAEFANMEVRAYSEEEWQRDPGTSAYTPDSSLAYNPETNTLYLRRERIKGDLPTLVSGIVHESGHFAERFAADSKAIADAWAALTDAEIVAAARDYSPDDTRSAAEIRADNRSRSEWFAQQFARVVTGRAASVPEGIRLKLASFFRAMKAWAVKYLGTDAAKSDALDREILRVMGFDQDAKPVEPEAVEPVVVGKNADGVDVFQDARGIRSVIVNGIRREERVGLRPVRTESGGISYAPEIPTAEDRARTEFETVQERDEAMTRIRAEAEARARATAAAINAEQPSPEPRATPETTPAGVEQGAGTYTPKRIAQLYAEAAPDMVVSVAAGNARRLAGILTDGSVELPELLYPENRVSRRVFKTITGVSLPNTLSGSRQAFAKWANEGRNVQPEAGQQTPRVVSPATPAPSKVDALADKLFDGLLGTPGELDGRPQPEDDFAPDELARQSSDRATDRGAQAAQRAGDALTGEAQRVLQDEVARRSQLREGGSGADAQARLSVAEQEQALAAWARANGHILDSDTFDARHREQDFRRGQEHEVIFISTPAGKRVVKRNYNRTVGPLAMNRDYAEYLDRIALHNATFPDTAVRLEGFMEMSQGLAPVISQDFIKSDGTTLSRDQIAAHMQRLGFRRVGEKKFINRAGLVVDDLHEKNILRDANGVIRVFDPVMRQEAPPVEAASLPEVSPGDLLGTPAERIEQRGFPKDRRQTAIDLAEAMIESGIRTPEGMAAYLDGKFAKKARPFSQSLWSMFAFADPSLASVPNWDAVYAQLDGAGAQADTPAQDEPTPGQQGDERAGGNEPAPAPVADGDQRPARMGDEQPVAGEGVAGGREPAPEAQGSGDQGATSRGGRSQGRSNSPRVDGDVGTLRRPDAQPEPVANSEPTAPADTPAFANYRITPADRIGEGGLTAKFRDNLAAIRTLKKILAEDRFATPAEKAVLVRYVGWGGLKSRFDPKSKDYSAELADLLTPEEYAAARRSVQDAHYTSPTVITRGIYPAMLRFGFRGGKMVEGGLGIGHFIGMMPDALRAGSSYLGIERDTITAQIAQKLYPEAKIHNVGLQEAPLARDSFDASVGNPPFGEQRLSDKAFKDEARYSIHNYFIAKQLALLRPGGVAGYVVSHYFLDSKDPSARQFIAQSAQFLGAIRLPNTAFKQNANTEVTTDIVFFRKLAPGEQAQANADWVNVGTMPEPGTGKPMTVNSWFVGRPEMMLGKLTLQGSMYAGRDELTLEPTGKDQDLGADLDAAVARLPENVYSHVAPEITDRLSTPEPVAQPPAAEGVPDGVRVGAFYIGSDGKLMRRAQDVNLEKQAEAVAGIKEADEARIKGMVRVRDALNALVRAEFNTESTEAELDALRATLNRTYDAFVKQHGLLNRPVNRRAFFSDPEAFRILGLETDYDAGISSTTAKKQGGTAREPSAKKAAIFAKRVNLPYREVTSVGSAKEALAVALNQRGEVDLPYMTELSGIPEADLIRDLDGLIFRTPPGGFQSREQYLSGNVRQKLKQAEAAMEKEGDAWRPNVEALRAVIPADIPAVDIAVPAGAGWVPAEDVRQFVRELTGAAPDNVVYRKSDGGWLFTMEQSTPATRETWGVSLDGRVVDFSRLFADILNVKPTIIYDKTDDDKQVVNERMTALAAAKSEEIKAKWADWIWQSADRRERLARIYNDQFNNYVDPRYDGSHLTLPGASPLVKLRQHQLNVIWRTITERRALYDHVVGAGKTFAGIGAFMEMRRMGRVRKPLFVVPNHLTKQWADEFVKLYPNANVLYTSPKDFDKDNRQTLFAKILTGEYDAVIIGHSQFKKVGVSREIERGILQEMIDEITESIEAMKAAEGKRRSRAVAQAEKTREKITEKLKALADDAGARDSVATFEELGIDGLFVDEAHEFKNLFYTTQMQRVAGLGSPAGSAKAFDLYLKTRYMHTRFGGKAPLVFATGTPISNSLVEMFTMQRYLQPDTLADMGLKTLDAWVKVFGDVKQVYEVDPTGTGYRMATRLAQFQNVGEISAIYRTVADVITMGDLMAQSEARGERFPVPKLAGGKPNNYVADRTPDQAAYFGIETQVVDETGRPVFDADGSPRVEYPKGTLLHRVDNLPDDPKVDNMLKITNDARKAGLDMRLVDPSYPDRPESKVNRAVAEIVAIHKKWAADRGTQLVFCDLSVPASARGDATKKAKEKLAEFYFTQQDGQILPLEDAKPVTLKASPEGLEWFVAKSPKTGNWRVYERSSGLAMRGSEKTRTAAIATAEQNLAGFDPATLKANIEKGRPTPEQLSEARNQWLDAQEAAEAADQATGDGEDAAGAEDGDTSAVSMDELLADSSKHSVYDDMKAKLIAAGIPDKEIAFIHDYKTPLAKQKLFDQMNRGEVRVLFGSTPKLGAGTNVQKRLVALHHLDAPWRPSDLEQREGRIIRQGNELYQRDPDGFEVVVNRYATKQTYDTRMWQLLEHKARGVEGFRKADRSTRRLEDVAGEAANASDMKAAASGDPLIQREIELRNERSKLELLKRAYQSNRYDQEDRAKWLRAAPQRRDDAVRVLQEKIAARQPVPEDPWTFTKADGTVHEEKKGMAEVLADAIKRAADSANGNAPVGVYRGYEVNVRRQVWKGDTIVEVQMRPAGTQGNRDTVTTYEKGDTISDIGLVQRLDNYLAHFEAKVEEENIQAQRAADNLARIEGELAKPFAKEADLDRVRQEHEQVKAQLLQKRSASRPAQQGDAPMGTPSEPTEAQRMFTDLLQELPDRARDIVRSRIGGETFESIGARYGFDAKRAESLFRSALGLTRARLRKRMGEGGDDAVGGSPARISPTPGTGGGQTLGTPRERQTDTPEFRRWFGDSKVVDAEGKPLVVYHGTTRQFTEFGKVSDLNRLDGFYFGSQKDANFYAGENDGGQVIPAYLAIRNPASKDDMERVSNGIPMYADKRGERVKQALIAEGFDGAVLYFPDSRETEYVAFLPTQIKSAIGNSGAFDPENPSILGTPSEPTPSDDDAIREHLDALRTESGLDAAKLEADYQKAIAEQVGERTVGDPRFANPGATDATRAVTSSVDEQRRNEMERESHDLWQAEAERQIAANFPAVVRDLLERVRGGLDIAANPVAVKAAQIAVERLSREAVTSGDAQKLRDAQTLAYAYRVQGSEQARALAARRDPFRTPQQRMAEFFSGILFTPPQADRKAIAKAWTPREKARRIEELTQQLDGTRRLLAERERILAEREAQAQQPATSPVAPATPNVAPAPANPDSDVNVRRLKARIAEIEGELDRVRKRLDREEKLHDINAKRLQKINRVLSKMGVTVADLFAGDAVMRLKGERIVQNVAAERDWDDTKKRLAKLAAQGWDKASILKKLKLSEADARRVYEDIRRDVAARLAALGTAALDAGNLESVVGPNDSGPLGTPAEPGMGDEIDPEKAKKIEDMLAAMGLVGWEELDSPVRKARVENAERKRAEARKERAKKPREPKSEPAAPGETVTPAPDKGAWVDDPDALPPAIDPTNPADATRVAREAQSADSDEWDMAHEFWINSILSGPLTQAANITGNSLNVAWTLGLKRGLEATVNDLFIRRSDLPQLREYGHMLRAVIPAIRRAWGNAVFAFSTEQSYFARDILETPLALANDGFDDRDSRAPSISGTKGRIIRIPVRLLGAVDDFTKTITASMEAAAHAYRIAKTEGMSGEAMEKRMAGLINTPGSAAWLAAYDAAQRMAFQEEHGGDTVVGKIELGARVARRVPGVRYLVPFVKTPLNIFTQGIRQSPFGTIALLARYAGAMREKQRSGTAIRETFPVDEQLGRIVEQFIAYSIAAMLYGAAAGDDDDEEKGILITGALPETTTGLRALAQRAAITPYTLRVGDYQLRYNRIEPLATILGATVDMLTAAKRARNEDRNPVLGALSAITTSITAQAENKTMLAGVESLMEAVKQTRQQQDIGAGAKEWAASFLSSWIPNILRQPVRMADPVVRERNATSFPEMVAENVVPQLNEPMVDVLGREVEKGGNALARLTIPAEMRARPELERVDRLLLNWNQTREDPEERWAPSPIPGRIKIEGRWRPMTDEERSRYATRSGQLAANMLRSAALNTERPTQDDIDRIKRAFTNARQIARREVFGGTSREE